MTLYVCAKDGCKKQFVYASKHTTRTIMDIRAMDGATGGANYDERPTVETEITIMRCPHPNCGSLDFKEYVEPKALEPNITNVRSMPIDANAAIDKLLGEGYVVHELYAKTVTLVKREEVIKQNE